LDCGGTTPLCLHLLVLPDAVVFIRFLRLPSAFLARLPPQLRNIPLKFSGFA